MKKMMTALVRNAKGDLQVRHDDFYSSQKDFADELRANGYRVLKTWRGKKTYADIEDWEYFETMKMIMTALVRNKKGDLKIINSNCFTSQKDFAIELRANGYRVLKTWRGEITQADMVNWEFFNRK